MARDKKNQQNIDNSNPADYPNARIRNNDGSGNGTPVDESVYGDIHEFHAKIMREAKVDYNNLPDNNTNGYQLYDALMSLGGKNDMIKEITKLTNDTLLIPIKLSALKIDESIIFYANFDSSTQMIFIKGVDNSIKNLIIAGKFYSGQKVRLINNTNNISLVGLYDSENVPDLAQTITTINNTFVNLQKILAVFIPGGTMMFWNKPANTIPAGWQEVVDWRGRMPIGLLPTDSDWDAVGKEGGEKTHKLTIPEMPSHSHGANTGREKVGTGNQNGASANGGTGSNISITNTGGDQPHNNMPPFRVVLFIEFIG